MDIAEHAVVQPVRGTGHWHGIVMIVRPDTSNMPHDIDPLCKVGSAPTIELNGRRAIYAHVPYSVVKHLFCSDDGDHCFAEAELHGEHLEFYNRSRSCLKDWILYCNVQGYKAPIPNAFE
jgi:hypothetical protein